MKHKLKGFTLVETIIAFVLLMLVIASSVYVLFSVTDIFARQTDAKLAQASGNGIVTMLEDKLKYAVNIKLTDVMPDKESEEGFDEAIYILNGKVCYVSFDKDHSYTESNDLYGENFYNGGTVAVTIKPHDLSLAELTVDVYGENTDSGDDPDFSRTETVKLLNVSHGNGSLDATDSFSYVGNTSKPIYILLKM